MQEVQKTEKRKDTRGRVLRTGESQRPDGSYQFRWSEGGERRTMALVQPMTMSPSFITSASLVCSSTVGSIALVTTAA